jgi:hypothetical protein
MLCFQAHREFNVTNGGLDTARLGRKLTEFGRCFATICHYRDARPLPCVSHQNMKAHRLPTGRKFLSRMNLVQSSVHGLWSGRDLRDPIAAIADRDRAHAGEPKQDYGQGEHASADEQNWGNQRGDTVEVKSCRGGHH